MVNSVVVRFYCEIHESGFYVDFRDGVFFGLVFVNFLEIVAKLVVIVIYFFFITVI